MTALAERLVRALDVSRRALRGAAAQRRSTRERPSGELGAELRRSARPRSSCGRSSPRLPKPSRRSRSRRARLEAEADEARRRLEAGRTPTSRPRATTASSSPRRSSGSSAAARRSARSTRSRKEEYEAEKERLEELAAQRADLEESLAELEKLRNELAETVERRFAETFDAVSSTSTRSPATLFPGGEGRLRLTEPEEDEDEEPGVEVELRPAGKRVQRLSLLSGGEKALGAISFLFALFLARPCPFYLLDEVEAALDDANIGRFVELLRRYSDRAQFVVITHQKRTMEAADVLYGVTMGGDGVSQIVSRRLPREEARPRAPPRLRRALRPGRVRAADRRAVGRGARPRRHRGDRRGRRRRVRSRSRSGRRTSGTAGGRRCR